MSSPKYLNYGNSSYKQGCIVIGTSTKVSNGNALNDPNITIIQIPSYHNGKEVVEIGYAGFCCTKIEKIFIPKNILFLNDNCLYFCTELTEIRFEEGSRLEKHGKYSITSLPKLVKLDVPNSLSFIDTENGYPGFHELTALTCISYLGKTDFSSYWFFNGIVPANIYVSSSHPNKFGGSPVTGRDKSCGVSKIPLNYNEYIAGKGKTRNGCSCIIHRYSPNYFNYMFLFISS